MTNTQPSETYYNTQISFVLMLLLLFYCCFIIGAVIYAIRSL